MPDDFKFAVLASSSDTFENSKVLLARADADGTLELLTAAWEAALGYAREEFREKRLSHLLQPGMPAARAAVAILDEKNMAPVDLKMRCRDGQGKDFRLHRWFDAYERRMYVVADEHPGG